MRKPTMRKPTPTKAEPVPEWRRRQIALERRRDKAVVSLGGLLGFWRQCSRRECRRRRICSGEPRPCFDKNWQRLSPWDKAFVQALVRQLVSGRTPAEAIDLAEAETKRHDAVLAEMEPCAAGEENGA